MTSQLSYVNGEIEQAGQPAVRLDDAQVLLELAEAEADPGVLTEVESEITGLTKAIEEMEVRTLLSGEYDSREALVAIRAGAGGVDAADFAEMLLRMYLRWAERHGYPTEVYDTSYAEEAGLKSATFAVKVPYAYGTLSVESGTHRLVRISPFDNQGRRQTSFAGVEVAAGRRADRPHRHPGERDPGRRLPLVRPGWAERQHHRLGGAAHPHPDRHRGDLPEREVPAAEQGLRAARAPGPAAGAQAPGGAGQDGGPARTTRPARGATRCAPTSCTRTRW